MWMLGFLVGRLVSCIDTLFALFVPARPPNQAAGHSLDKVTWLSSVFYTFQNTLAPILSRHYYQQYHYYHYYHYIVSLPLDQLLLWRLGISNQAEVYLDCSFCPSILLHDGYFFRWHSPWMWRPFLQLSCLFGTGSSIICILWWRHRVQN